MSLFPQSPVALTIQTSGGLDILLHFLDKGHLQTLNPMGRAQFEGTGSQFQQSEHYPKLGILG